MSQKLTYTVSRHYVGNNSLLFPAKTKTHRSQKEIWILALEFHNNDVSAGYEWIQFISIITVADAPKTEKSLIVHE